VRSNLALLEEPNVAIDSSARLQSSMLRTRRRVALVLVTYVIEPLYETHVGLIGYNDSINMNLQGRDLAG
jgi:hypothetical protein